MRQVFRLFVVLVSVSAATASANQDAAEISNATLSRAARQANAKPKDVSAQLAYAGLLRTLFRLDQARARAAAAAKLAPEQVAPWMELAMIETLAGRRGVAGSHAQRATRMGGSAEAKELLARLTAAVRIGTGKPRKLPVGSPLQPAEALVAAALSRDFHGLAAHVDWKLAGERAPGLAAGYGRYLQQSAGAKWLGAEIVAGDDAARARAYLLWRVSPADADLDVIAALPPGYRGALPLSWWSALSGVESKLRDETIERARRATWSEVTTLELELADGKVVAVRSPGGDLLSEKLSAEAVEVAPPPPAKETADSKDNRGPASMDDETFGNRYGKKPPATGDAYRYEQILLGLAIVLVMLLGVIALVRREKRTGRSPNR